MPRPGVTLAILLATLCVGAAAQAPAGEEVPRKSGVAPVSGFVYDESGAVVEGVVVILESRSGDEYRYQQMTTPADGHYFFMAPAGEGRLSCVVDNELIQRFGDEYGLTLRENVAVYRNLIIDDLAPWEPPPVEHPPEVVEEPYEPHTPKDLAHKPHLRLPLPEPPPGPGPFHVHLGGGYPFVGELGFGYRLHEDGYLNLIADLVYAPSEEYIAQTLDPAVTLDYDLFLGETWCLHLGLGPGVFFRTDQTLFILKAKGGLALRLSPRWALSAGVDYFPVIGDIFFGRALNVRAGVEFFF